MTRTIEQRIERLESTEEIRQLVAKYSLSLDMRDLDAHVNLFAEDIRVSREKVGNHIIEFDDDDNAHGIVYSKNEHETPSDNGDEWVIMQMIYWDNYQRIDGQWYFRRRFPCYWYATDLNKPPVGDKKMRWPDRDTYDGAWHQLFPSWENFWQQPPTSNQAEVAKPAPIGEFLNTMRGDGPFPKIQIR